MTAAAAVTGVASILLGAALLLAVTSSLRVRQFLARTPLLAGPEDLAQFKRLVGRQMYTALATLGLALAAAGLLAVALWQGWLDWDSLLPLFVVSAVLFTAAGFWSGHAEARAKQIAVADESLWKERDHVIQT